MQKYPRKHWLALGRWVHDARHQAGLSDTQEWASAVGRSDRMLLGLERGETVGPKTIEAIANALGVANWALFEVLHTGEVDVAWSDDNVDSARELFERETGLAADREPDVLEMFSNDELLAEVARRMRPHTGVASVPDIEPPAPRGDPLQIAADDPESHEPDAGAPEDE